MISVVETKRHALLSIPVVTCTNCINVLWKRRRGTSGCQNEYISIVLHFKNLLVEGTNIKETFFPAMIICGVNNA